MSTRSDADERRVRVDRAVSTCRRRSAHFVNATTRTCAAAPWEALRVCAAAHYLPRPLPDNPSARAQPARAMAEAATDHHWKDRYRELLRDYEDKEREWAALEKALRTAASRLALASLGESSELDEALEALADKLRGKATAREVDTSVSAVMRRLHVHDTTRTNLQFTDVPALLAKLVRALRRVPYLDEVADKLEKRLAALPPDGWVEFMQHVAREIGVVVTTLRAQRVELEEFLEHVTRQLTLLEGFTTWQVSAAEKRRSDTAGLGRTMESELEELNREVESTGDLSSIKAKVQKRLTAVAMALQEFRDSEARREAEHEERAASLRREVAELTSRTAALAEKCASQESRLLIDSLTHVGSRYAYEQRLEEEHARWQRHDQPLSFAIFDLDHFKRVNDELGHDTGDRLLRAVAELLDRNKRTEDFVARVGGEEFVLLLPMTPLASARVVVEKLRAVVENANFQYKGRREQITISCGVTEFRQGDTPSAVYDRADRALYRAKEEGRNRCIAD